MASKSEFGCITYMSPFSSIIEQISIPPKSDTGFVCNVKTRGIISLSNSQHKMSLYVSVT